VASILLASEIILKANGKRGVPQGGVISPVLSNLYLNEVDQMLERARERTRLGKLTAVTYARYADDLVILIHADPRHSWLLKAVDKRLVEIKVRRHLMRARKRRGLGWDRWTTQWLHAKLALFNGYRVRRELRKVVSIA